MSLRVFTQFAEFYFQMNLYCVICGHDCDNNDGV